MNCAGESKTLSYLRLGAGTGGSVPGTGGDICLTGIAREREGEKGRKEGDRVYVNNHTTKEYILVVTYKGYAYTLYSSHAISKLYTLINWCQKDDPYTK